MGHEATDLRPGCPRCRGLWAMTKRYDGAWQCSNCGTLMDGTNTTPLVACDCIPKEGPCLTCSRS